jgi:hypothetical protein
MVNSGARREADCPPHGSTDRPIVDADLQGEHTLDQVLDHAGVARLGHETVDNRHGSDNRSCICVPGQHDSRHARVPITDITEQPGTIHCYVTFSRR